MVIVTDIRCVLLSSPYASSENPEIKKCFPNGAKRTIGMVEVTLSNGVTGLGEGYLAVFAPLVFKSIVELCKPNIMGKDGFDISARVNDLRSLCDYWSLQGAARHVISAFEIALQDAKGKSFGVPVYDLLGGANTDVIQIYGSGGCCDTKEQFLEEFEHLCSLGIKIYKIRASRLDVLRTAWVLEQVGKRNVRVGVDMCQKLADPPQKVEEVVGFINAVHKLTKQRMFFVEETIGPDCPEDFKALRKTIDVPVCGGEIITTSKEMIDRVKNNVYDFVQPDASVIGGISAVMDVFAAATPLGTSVVVHAWGGAAAIMANYHAAFAASGLLVEYPMFSFPLGSEMMADQRKIIDGKLSRPTASGLGVSLSPDMERRYAFDPSAVYSCALLDVYQPPDSYW